MSRALLLGAVVVALLVAATTLLVLRLGDGAGDEVTGRPTPTPTSPGPTATPAPTPTATATPTPTPTPTATPTPTPDDDEVADAGDALPGEDAEPAGEMPDTGGGLALALLLLAAGCAMMRRQWSQPSESSS